jgi:HlyD family secretion protein
MVLSSAAPILAMERATPIRSNLRTGKDEDMAAITNPRGTRRFPIRWPVAAVGSALVVAAVVVTASGFANRSTPSTTNVATMSRGSITATVTGIGSVAPAQTLDLAFPSAGTVSEVLVKAGAAVDGGQPLARLDDRTLKSQVASAQAKLAAEQAKLTQAKEGNAKPEEIAAARAALASAKASYDKTTAGPSAADVANAEASLKSAEASLKDTLAGPTASDVASAEASVSSEESAMATAQKELADLKAQPKPEDIKAAELAVEQAKDSLWSAQLSRDATCGPSHGQGGACQSADANVAAQQTALDQAAVKLAQAKEPATAAQLAAAEEAVRSAQAGLASAQAGLAKVKAGPTAGSRQSAQSQVDEAKASLLKAQTSVTASDLAVAKASVDQAQANLDKLTAKSTDSDLAIQQASVDQAEQSLLQAQLNFDNATLRAPFAGVISAVNVVPGSTETNATVVATLIDRSMLHVDLKLSENDVVKVSVGQPAALTSDSIAGWSAKGQVSYVAPSAETTNGVATYAVRASFSDVDPKLRVGMTANVGITTAHRDNVLLVPNTALLPKGSGHVIQQPGPDGKTTTDTDVQIGLTDGTQSEIVSGLHEGDRFIPLPVTGPVRGSGFFGG